jgi:hypothetical protein
VAAVRAYKIQTQPEGIPVYGRKRGEAQKARDIETGYPTKRFVKRLIPVAECLESGRPFAIQAAGEHVHISADAVINIELERDGDNKEIEPQLTWTNMRK